MLKNCIDTNNYEKLKIIFTEKQRENKSLKHPELREKGFIKRIKTAVENPSFIYEDLAKKGRLLYYKYEYSLNGRDRYTKVVVKKQKRYLFIITAYRPDFVKERGKTRLIYGEDN